MADIGNLIVKIGADASQLERAFSQLGGSASQFQRGLETVGKVGATAFFSAATAATAMAIAAGKQAEELGQLAVATGINTDKLQEYDVMLNQAGLSGDDLARVIKTVSTSLDQARQGTGTAGDRFRQLGIDIRTVTSTDDLIKKISQAASQFADGLGKTAIMTDLFGRGWRTFLKTFQGGRAAFEEVERASKSLGLTMSTSNLATLETMDNKIDDLMTSFKRFGQQLGVVMAPSITMITTALTSMLSFGSRAMHELNLQLDVMAVKVLHLGLQAKEILGTLFSTNVFSGEAWKQALANVEFIGKEAEKQIKTLKAAHAFSREVKPPIDTRPVVPQMVDTSKVSQQQLAMADAMLKANEQAFKEQDNLAKAKLTKRIALLDAAKQAGIRTETEVAEAQQAAVARMNAFVAESLALQLSNYQQFHQDKLKLFTDDQKGIADRNKFEVEAAAKELDLQNQIQVAAVNADTARIQSAAAVLAARKADVLIPLQTEMSLATANFELQKSFYAQAPGMIGAANAVREAGLLQIQAESTLRRQAIENTIQDERRKMDMILALEQEMQAKRRGIAQQFPTFWERQMQDVVSSNAFSVSSIITSWTSGVAGAIVNNQDFVKSATKATELAIVQGALNTGVQLAAQWALQASVEIGILTATEATKLGLKTATNAAIVAGDTVAAGASVSIWGGASTAILGFFATTLAGFEAIVATMVSTVTAVGEFIMGVLAAIAEALTDTIFGIPWAGAIVVGIALIAAALAATGNLGFKKGGIGDFGAGTPAMLHGQEAIIPLDGRGASFLQQAFGGSQGAVTQTIMLDGRVLARSVADKLPSVLRLGGVPA